ncbi:hypothetical protein [Meridianimarinicoccus roseus]|nr:hypothetical protein [Meridianimarinicoccus roseus]
MTAMTGSPMVPPAVVARGERHGTPTPRSIAARLAKKVGCWSKPKFRALRQCRNMTPETNYSTGSRQRSVAMVTNPDVFILDAVGPPEVLNSILSFLLQDGLESQRLTVAVGTTGQ